MRSKPTASLFGLDLWNHLDGARTVVVQGERQRMKEK